MRQMNQPGRPICAIVAATCGSIDRSDRPFLSSNAEIALIHSFVASCPDNCSARYVSLPAHGRRLRRTGGTVPQKLKVVNGSCIRPPNISRSSVIGCGAKY